VDGKSVNDEEFVEAAGIPADADPALWDAPDHFQHEEENQSQSSDDDCDGCNYREGDDREEDDGERSALFL
jgi:hypothetical protein